MSSEQHLLVRGRLGKNHLAPPRPFAQAASRAPTPHGPDQSGGVARNSQQQRLRPLPLPLPVGLGSEPAAEPGGRADQRKPPLINKPPCACPAASITTPSPNYLLSSRPIQPRKPASAALRPRPRPPLRLDGRRKRSIIQRDHRGASKDVNCHRPKIVRPQIRWERPGRRSGGRQGAFFLRRLRAAAAPRDVGAPALRQARGLRGGRAHGEAGRAGRGGARVRGARGHLHPRGGRERRRGAALLLPRRVLLHLRGQDVGRRGRPVRGVVPRRQPDGGRVPPHLHLLPQGGLRHPHPQGRGPVLECSCVQCFNGRRRSRPDHRDCCGGKNSC